MKSKLNNFDLRTLTISGQRDERPVVCCKDSREFIYIYIYKFFRRNKRDLRGIFLKKIQFPISFHLKAIYYWLILIFLNSI